MRTRAIASITGCALLLISGCAGRGTTAEGLVGKEALEACKNIEMIVPFKAGGPTDTVARLAVPQLESSLGVNMNVINREGSSGQLGLSELARSNPDGCTIGIQALPGLVTTYVGQDRNADYDMSDFTPIAGLTAGPTYIAVHTQSPYKSFEELVADAKANPGKVTVAGIGDDDRLVVERIEKAAGIKFNLIPFDSGSEKTAALLGRKVDMTLGGGTAVLPQEESGDFRILLVLSDKPSPFIPDAPTSSSLGLDVREVATQLVLAPSGVPSETVAVLEEELKKVTAAEEFTKGVETNFVSPNFLSATEATELWEATETELTKDANG